MTDEKEEIKNKEAPAGKSADPPKEKKPDEDEKNEEEEGKEPSSSKSPLEESKEVLAGMREQNKIYSDNLKKQEKLQAEALLGGHSSAGAPEKTQDDKDIDSARELLKGSGYEDELFPQTS